MSRSSCPHSPSRRLLRAGLLSVSALAASLPFCVQAQAQSGIELRGEISEDQANQEILVRRRPAENLMPRSPAAGPATQSGKAAQVAASRPAPGYTPSSDGALTSAEEEAAKKEDAQGGFLAEDPAAQPENPFADAPPLPQQRPSTALKRAREQKERAAGVRENQRTSPASSAANRTAQRAGAATEPEAVEDEYGVGVRRGATVDAVDRADLRLDAGAERTGAIEGLGRRPDEGPFKPLGIRAGTFILRPSFEQGFTYSTNANSSPEGSEAVLSESTLRLNAVSDWSQHRASLDAYGTFDKSLSGEDYKSKEGGVDAALDLDLSHEYRLKTTAGYSAKPESASAAVFIDNVVDQPLRQNFNGSVGLSKELGKLEFGVTGRADRNVYGEAEYVNGGTLNQDERNSTLATVSLRAGYEISPAITPFTEVEIGRRYYDKTADSLGYERSADHLAVRGGVAVDMNEKLVGEFSAGWLRESFDDDRLDPITGLSLKSDLRWSPERGTVVGLAASTNVEGAVEGGKSGSLLHSAKLSVEREIRANVTANAALGVDWRTYYGQDGKDLLLSGEVGATWWWNRYLGLVGRARYERQTSDLPGRDFDKKSVFLGVKVQR